MASGQAQSFSKMLPITMIKARQKATISSQEVSLPHRLKAGAKRKSSTRISA